MTLDDITKEAISGIGCDRESALDLVLNCSTAELKNAANAVREHFFAKKIKLCSIINAKSGVCDMDCRFCSQSAHNKADAPVYPFLETDKLTSELKLNDCYNVNNCGIVTSGGKLSSDDIDKFIESVNSVRPNVHFDICASFGRLSDSDIDKLKGAGVNRLHHNLETSQAFYPDICSTQSWSDRLDTVKAALAKGMKVCCGGLFGLGESWADRIELALSIALLGIDSVPINFLYPHPGTPLENNKLLSPDDALKIIAIYRLILPDRTIRICGGRITVLGDRQGEMFEAGANALMTGNYLTTSGQTPETDILMINNLGYSIE